MLPITVQEKEKKKAAQSQKMQENSKLIFTSQDMKVCKYKRLVFFHCPSIKHVISVTR